MAPKNRSLVAPWLSPFFEMLPVMSSPSCWFQTVAPDAWPTAFANWSISEILQSTKSQIQGCSYLMQALCRAAQDAPACLACCTSWAPRKQPAPDLDFDPRPGTLQSYI